MNQTQAEKRVYEVLESLGIPFIRREHPPVYTVEEAKLHWRELVGARCKNLFLRNKKGNRHYLVILEHSKNADLRKLTGRLGEDRLSFGSAERLQRFLGLEPGALKKKNHEKLLNPYFIDSFNRYDSLFTWRRRSTER